MNIAINEQYFNGNSEDIGFGKTPSNQNIPGFIKANSLKKQEERYKKQASPL